MFDNSAAFNRFASRGIKGIGSNVVQVDYINSGQTKVIAVANPSINRIVLTSGAKSITTMLSYKSPDGCLFGEIGDVMAIDLVPTAAGLQITNNEPAQLIVNLWEV